MAPLIFFIDVDDTLVCVHPNEATSKTLDDYEAMRAAPKRL